MKKQLALLASIFLILTLCLACPAFAQETPPEDEAVTLSVDDILASIDAACDCELNEDDPEEDPEDPEEVSGDDDDSNEAAPGHCMSQISKLKRSLKNLDFFGLLSEELSAYHDAVRNEKRTCKQARKEDRRDKRRGPKDRE